MIHPTCKALSWLALPSGLWAGIGVTGCVAVDSAQHVRRAIELTEQQTGNQPDWTQEWDADPPDWSVGTVLTMDQAVDLALRNQRELRAEIEMIGQAQADLVQAGLLQNPVLTLGAKLPSGGGRALFEGGLVPFQGLRDLWLIPVRKELANATLQQAILRAANMAVSVSAQAKILYARIQYSQRAIELTRENLAIVDQTVSLIQSRHAAGRTPQIEVNTERIRHLRLQSDLLAMQSEHQRLKRELLALMGFADARDAWSVEPIHESEGSTSQTAGDAALLATALDQRLDLCAARWELWAAQTQWTLARSEAWPALDVSVAFERDAAPRSQNPSFAAIGGNAALGSLTGSAPEPPMIEPFGPKPRDSKWMVGPMIDLEIPIFDQNQAQIAKAAHELRRRWALYSALEQTTIQKVQEFKILHDQSSAQVKLFREAIIPEVDSNLALIQQAYRAGADVFTVYLRAQEDLIATRVAALAFVRDAAINRAELEREVGGRLPACNATADGEKASPENAPPHHPIQSEDKP